MKYGYFDDAAKEYVINTPATPLPWINYLGTNGFFGLVSNTGGGYNFYKDAKLRRITRYRYNNTPNDLGGRCYYISDNDTIWSPGFLPAKTQLDSYKCRHGLGYTTIESSKNNLEVSLTCFVPLNETCEVNRLTFNNTSNLTKSFKFYSALEWCLWDAVDDSTNFQRNLNIGEVEIADSTIYHKTEYRERRNHYAFYHANKPVDGFDTDRATFLGQFGNWDKPEMVEKQTSGNSVASGWSPMASHRIEMTLKPGEKVSIILTLGYVELPVEDKWEANNIINKAPALEIINKFSSDAQVNNALLEIESYWDKLLSKYYIVSNDDKINRMVNIWNQYQCMTTFNMSRSASYFESGTGRGMGFRDSCQDLLGFVHMIPDRARERILDIAAIQFEDGSTYHQYQPLTKRGNADAGIGFNDDPLWLVACTCAYIRETGDISILDEAVPFDNDATKAKSLLEHLRRSLNYTIYNKGPHNLPLIGRADWNDCLNLNCFSTESGESFQTCSNFESGKAESVFIAAMFVKYAAEYSDLCDYISLPEEGKAIRKEISLMEDAVKTFGWDGDWFIRAYDAFENKVGSNECPEGKIYIEPQGFAIMAGIGHDDGRAKTALESVEKLLVNDYGVELLWPCYTKYHKELGEITSYPPGYKENGAVFCHNNPWICLAYASINDSRGTWNTYIRNCPAYLEDVSEIHRTEPYVYSQMIAGRDAANYGEAKNSWLTGTAAWTFVSISQGLLGIYPEYNGLRVKPCIPAEFGDYMIKRNFRNTEYTINVYFNTNKHDCLTINGVNIEGNIIPISTNPSTCVAEYYV